jgi:hypothetical protein
MLSKEFENFLGKKIMLVRIIWAALFINMFFLFVVISIINKNPIDWNIQNAFQEGPIPVVMSFMAVLFVLGSLKTLDFFKSSIAKKKWNRDDFIKQLELSVGENGAKVYSIQDIAYFQSLNDEHLKVFRTYNSLFPAFIIQFALNEAIAILGFVLAVINKNTAFLIPFGIVGVVMMAISFPKFRTSEIPG